MVDISCVCVFCRMDKDGGKEKVVLFVVLLVRLSVCVAKKKIFGVVGRPYPSFYMQSFGFSHMNNPPGKQV